MIIFRSKNELYILILNKIEFEFEFVIFSVKLEKKINTNTKGNKIKYKTTNDIVNNS